MPTPHNYIFTTAELQAIIDLNNSRIRFRESLERIRARREAKLKQRQRERAIERRYSNEQRKE